MRGDAKAPWPDGKPAEACAKPPNGLACAHRHGTNSPKPGSRRPKPSWCGRISTDHDNIIRYAQRPFGGAFHMNTQLLANAQAHVDPDQWLLFVGDLAMWKDQARIAEWMAQCPGRKALIIGNHDVRGRECPQRLEDWQALGFDAVADVAWLPRAHGLPETWITHYPLPLNVFRGKAINLHGHTHTNAFGPPWANACVEQNDYRPRPILELLNPALR